MTDTQKMLLEMLDAFHKICEQENLRYYLLGGTALGAARHEGFIPWDDDIDVGIPREDYERLKEICAERDFGIYCFEFPGEDDFVYPFGKFYNMNTTLIENTRYKAKRGVYIDVFPLDGIGNTYEESVQNFKPIISKINLLSTKVCAWRKGRKLYKNLGMIALRYMPGPSVKKIMADIERMSKQRSFEDSLYVANCVGNWFEKEIVKKEYFGEPTLYKFEGHEFYAPEDIDGFLTSIYGDWRKLPPKEKQVSHHDYVLLDLNKSYKSEE